MVVVDREKFYKTKNKPFLVAKLFLKRMGKSWNLTETIRVANQLKKYEQEDVHTLARLYEYLSNNDVNIPSNPTIYKVLALANEYVTSKEKPATKECEVVDLLNYL